MLSSVNTPGGIQKMMCVNESGLYQLVLKAPREYDVLPVSRLDFESLGLVCNSISMKRGVDAPFLFLTFGTKQPHG